MYTHSVVILNEQSHPLTTHPPIRPFAHHPYEDVSLVFPCRFHWSSHLYVLYIYCIYFAWKIIGEVVVVKRSELFSIILRFNFNDFPFQFDNLSVHFNTTFECFLLYTRLIVFFLYLKRFLWCIFNDWWLFHCFAVLILKVGWIYFIHILYLKKIYFQVSPQRLLWPNFNYVLISVYNYSCKFEIILK